MLPSPHHSRSGLANGRSHELVFRRTARPGRARRRSPGHPTLSPAGLTDSARNSARSPRTRSPTSTHPACGLQRGDRDQRGRPRLGGRGRASGLPPALPERLRLPLPAAGLEAATPRDRRPTRRLALVRESPSQGVAGAAPVSLARARTVCCRPSPLAQSIRPPSTRRTRVVRCRPCPHPDATWSAATRSSRGLRASKRPISCEQCDLKPEVDAAIGHRRTSRCPNPGKKNAICDYRALDTQARERTEFQGLRRC